jgi:hypothetical protein
MTASGSSAQAQTTETQYLLGHQAIKVILALRQVPLQVAHAAVKAAHAQASIAGFDLRPQISNSIENGSILATVEQQPYLQGYYAVTQLALDLAYGSTPSNVDTGNAIVDKTNAGRVASLAGTVYWCTAGREGTLPRDHATSRGGAAHGCRAWSARRGGRRTDRPAWPSGTGQALEPRHPRGRSSSWSRSAASSPAWRCPARAVSRSAMTRVL